MLMFVPPWCFVASLCALSVALGAFGLGLVLGPAIAIDLMVIGGLPR
jgi:hypothetical protein